MGNRRIVDYRFDFQNNKLLVKYVGKNCFEMYEINKNNINMLINSMKLNLRYFIKKNIDIKSNREFCSKAYRGVFLAGVFLFVLSNLIFYDISYLIISLLFVIVYSVYGVQRKINNIRCDKAKIFNYYLDNMDLIKEISNRDKTLTRDLSNQGRNAVKRQRKLLNIGLVDDVINPLLVSDLSLEDLYTLFDNIDRDIEPSVPRDIIPLYEHSEYDDGNDYSYHYDKNVINGVTYSAKDPSEVHNYKVLELFRKENDEDK